MSVYVDARAGSTITASAASTHQSWEVVFRRVSRRVVHNKGQHEDRRALLLRCPATRQLLADPSAHLSEPPGLRGLRGRGLRAGRRRRFLGQAPGRTGDRPDRGDHAAIAGSDPLRPRRRSRCPALGRPPPAGAHSHRFSNGTPSMAAAAPRRGGRQVRPRPGCPALSLSSCFMYSTIAGRPPARRLGPRVRVRVQVTSHHSMNATSVTPGQSRATATSYRGHVR